MILAKQYEQAKFPPPLTVCNQCGAYVGKRREHTLYHKFLDGVLKTHERAIYSTRKSS